MRETIVEWATGSKIPVLWPEDFPVQAQGKRPPVLSLAQDCDFGANPCLDYGKFIERIPLCVIRPDTVEQLAESLRFCSGHGIPCKVRGAAHSAGGQVLLDNGVIIDTVHLNRIVRDEPEKEQITVEGGIWWLNLAESLQRQGRRPVVLTDNLRTSVAGTLSVGGFGDTSHLYGLQIHQVDSLRLATMDGRLLDLDAGDELFLYTLGGRGQLGVIAQATLKTLRRSSLLKLLDLRWHNLQQFIQDAYAIITKRLFEFCRTRFFFIPRTPFNNLVKGVAGNFQTEIRAMDESLHSIHPSSARPMGVLDFFRHYSQDPSENWKYSSPAMEMIFPLPEGLKAWQQINAVIIRSGLYRYLEHGASAMILQKDTRLPLAHLPDSEYSLLVALRPAMSLPAVRRYLPLLLSFRDRTLEAGGKIYLMSIEQFDPEFVRRQFGNVLPRFLELKRQYDPGYCLNPGLLP